MNVTLENSEAVLVFSHLLILYSFASESQDERLFVTTTSASKEAGTEGGEDLLPPWLYFLRNGCALLCTVWDYLESSPSAPLAEMWDIPLVIPSSPTPLLSHLLSIPPAPTSPIAWSEQETRLYEQAATDLSSAFASTASHHNSEFTTWDALRVWPMHISLPFLALVKKGHPGALVLLAYYCILLKKIEGHWYFQGRSKRLMGGILERLGREWWSSVKWPMEEIGVDVSKYGLE
jgi:hypothetical protein